MIQTCNMCDNEFLTEADTYVVMSKPTGWETNCGCYYTNKIKKLEKQLEDERKVVDIYADSENDYFVDHTQTRIINGTKCFQMKNIVQMAKLAREQQKKRNE